MAPFKVAIVGGGMTGLITALHLDRLGIDFLLFEAYNDITPDIGASLALYPNFLRVLDQLGVLEDALRESSEACTVNSCYADGKPIFRHPYADRLHAAAGGYGVRTFTRSQLLRILYRHISDDGKAKIHTGTRVSRIEELAVDDRVRVHTESGQAHDVDVVIGADGTHSIVRAEMWRMAEEAGSNAFANDKGEDAETEFACVFGLSTQTGDLMKDQSYTVSAQDLTIGVFGGINGEALWFTFFKAGEDKARRGLDFPEWSKEEGAEICGRYANAKLTDSTTFGDVYNNRYRMTTQACPNHCLRRWYWGSLICLGDSVAKTNPILAQGGAQGAESVLMLVDRIHDALENQKQDDRSTERLPKAQIEGILAGINAEREPRVRVFVDKSQQLIRISCWSTWLYRIVGKWITPLLPVGVIVGQILEPWKGAYQSTSLPPPRGPGGGFVAGHDAADDKGKAGSSMVTV